MKNFSFLLVKVGIVCMLLTSCQKKYDYLVKVHPGEWDEAGTACAYVSTDGDTIIPFGTYQHCYTDTFVTFAIVLTRNNRCIAIDRQLKEKYEVYWFDNGPDPIRYNRFRIVQNGKIGYANANGEIVIPPQFSCAEPFRHYRAKVTYSCSLIPQDEHVRMESDEWFFIDTMGVRLSESENTGRSTP